MRAPDLDHTPRSGLAGSLKFVALLAVIALALLAALLVFDVVSTEMFVLVAGRIIALAAIAAVAALLIAVLLRTGATTVRNTRPTD